MPQRKSQGRRLGYVKIYRRATENYLWNAKPFDKWHAFEYLIMRAAWKTHDVEFQGRIFTLNRADLITTRRQLRRDFGWRSDEKIRNFLKNLEKTDTIRTRTEQGCLRITLCNYDYYQGADDETEQEPDANRTETGHRPDRDRTPTKHQPDTIEEREERKEGEKGEKPAQVQKCGAVDGQQEAARTLAKNLKIWGVIGYPDTVEEHALRWIIRGKRPEVEERASRGDFKGFKPHEIDQALGLQNTAPPLTGGNIARALKKVREKNEREKEAENA